MAKKCKRLRQIRLELWKKNPQCFVCKKNIQSFSICSIEHVIPKCHGGTDGIRNLAISHKDCNSRRGSILCRIVWERINRNAILKDRILITKNEEFSRSVKAWRIKLRQDFLDWQESRNSN